MPHDLILGCSINEINLVKYQPLSVIFKKLIQYSQKNATYKMLNFSIYVSASIMIQGSPYKQLNHFPTQLLPS